MLTTTMKVTSGFLVTLLAVMAEVAAAKYSHGQEAEKLCQAYKKICPRGKVCAIQTLEWPRIMKFPVCVHEHEVKVRSKVCEQAPSPGSCGAQFRRWYFNVHMADCSWFTYGGCGGNDNNFRSREECQTVCIPEYDREGNVREFPTDVTSSRSVELYQNGGDQQRPSGNAEEIAYPVNNYDLVENTDQSSLNGVHSNTDQDSVNNNENSQWDVYRGAYAYTPAALTTPSSRGNNWDDNRSHRNRWTDVADRLPLEHRLAPTEHRRPQHGIPVYHHRQGAGQQLHHRQGAGQELHHRQGAGQELHHRQGAGQQLHHRLGAGQQLHRHQHSRSNWPKTVGERPLNFATGQSSKATHVADNNGRLRDTSDLRSQSLTDVSHSRDGRLTNVDPSNRRLTDLPINSRNLGPQHLESLAMQPPSFPTASIQRVHRGNNRQPLRAVSLLNQRPQISKTPVRALEALDRISPLTSSLEGRYAAEGNEMIRKFRKPGRQRKRDRNHSKKNRRKNRRRGRKDRRDPHKNLAIHDSNDNTTAISDNANDTSRFQPIELQSRRFAEFRRKEARFLPSESQGDDVEHIQQMDSQRLLRNQQQEERKKRGRRRRKKKGNGKRGRKGENQVQIDTEGEEVTETEEVASPTTPHQYYEKIHLFGILDKTQNHTEITT